MSDLDRVIAPAHLVVNGTGKISGVYCFTLRGTTRRYVGSSVNVNSRKSEHFTGAKRNKTLTRFSRALLEFGEDSFDFEILEVCERDYLLEREEYFIKIFDCCSNEGFNTLRKPTAHYGAVVSDATRKRIGDSLRGKKRTVEQCLKFSLAQKKRKKNPSMWAAMIASNKGRPLSAEHRAKIAAANTGKKASPETLVKLRESHLGIRPSEASKAKLSAALKGKKKGPEFGAKVSAGLMGKKLSPAHCLKISLRNKGRKRSQEELIKRQKTLARVGHERSVRIGFSGLLLTIKEWAVFLGISEKLLRCGLARKGVKYIATAWDRHKMASHGHDHREQQEA